MFNRYQEILEKKRRGEKTKASSFASSSPEKKDSRGDLSSNSQGDGLEELYFSEENSLRKDPHTPREKEEGEKKSENLKRSERKERISSFSSSADTPREDQEEGRKDGEKMQWVVEEDLLKCSSFLPSVCRETPLSMAKLKRELHIKPTPLVRQTEGVERHLPWLWLV